MSEVRTYIEHTSKRVFACALDWPGWVRSGRSEAAALEALRQYHARYAPVPHGAGLDFPAVVDFRVIDRVEGDSTTAFGAPSQIVAADRAELAIAERDRLLSLLAECWSYLDRVAEASAEGLVKGPRGGGRDRTLLLVHVLDAEVAYGGKVGVKLRAPDPYQAEAVSAHRAALWEGLMAADATSRWPMSYAVRRTAWHVMDHAWEIQDRQPV